jgi:amino acid adenylation domain-containing protein/non-ribosomal peptide synthase protein (TIGR01720 family)
MSMPEMTHIDIRQLAESAGIAPDQQEALAALLQEARLLRGGASRVSPLPRDGRGFPLSFAQHRLWVLDRLTGGTAAYNMPLATELHGTLDMEAIRLSISWIESRHEVLRTTFHASDDDVLQIVSDESRIAVPLIDLSLVPGDDRLILAREITAREVGRRFDLSQGPLFRCLVVRLSAQLSWLVATIHHIISDDWSVQILAREFAASLQAFHAGRSPALPELPIQYADFAVWQRATLAPAAMSEQVAFWRRKLESLPELSFPFALPRTQEADVPAEQETWLVRQELVDGLRPIAREFDTTMFVVLLTAFKLVLRHVSSQDEVVVGTDVAQRDVYEIEHLIGFFINQVVLRTDLSGVSGFGEAVERVRQTVREMSSYAQCPFEHVVSALRVERVWNRMPLFQTKFVYMNATAGREEIALEMPLVELPLPPAKFDIALEVVEAADGLYCALKYNAQMFRRVDIQNLAAAFRLILGLAARDYRRTLDDIDAAILATTSPSVLKESRLSALEAVQGPSRIYPGPETLHEAVAAQAASSPEAIAVVYGGTRLSYRELDRRANVIAEYLTGFGVTRESIVGIYLDRRLDLAAALLAVLKVGACWMPLDKDYPRQRLADQIEDARPACVITSRLLFAELGAMVDQVLYLEDNLIEETGGTSVRVSVLGQNAAYLTYTSGSTGRPKGVVNTHAAIVNRLRWMQEAYLLTPNDLVLQKTPLSFDVSVWELFWPLIAGATLVMAPQETHRDSAQLARLIASSGVTTVHFVPSMLSAFIEEPAFEECRSLKRVIVSGETLLPELVKRFCSRSSAELHNLYGPTEAAVDVTAWHCRPQADSDSIPIGRPIANTSLYICGPQLQPMPQGAEGELCIGGIAPARGYLRQASRTAAAFVPDPFSHLPGRRMYRTGDLGRVRSDGAIEFLGRIDSQVKIRGQRVELGEIETNLLQHPAILEASVQFQKIASGRHRLIAYLCLRNTLPTVDELRHFLNQRLPAFMLPDLVIVLPSLPRLPNGKLDRRSLPEPSREPSVPAPARTALEEAVCRLWKEVLRIAEVGIHDNFFSLGGDSILLLQVCSHARRLGLELQPSQIFQNPTPAELGRVLTWSVPHQKADAFEGASSAPLSPIQQWFFNLNSPVVDHFNQALLLDAKPELRTEWLRIALNLITAHHEAFRIRFRRSNTEWIQWLDDRTPSNPLTVIDTSAVREQDLSTLVESVIRRLQSSLNIVDGPLLRVALFWSTAATGARVVVIFHHLIVDGVSWRIFLEDLETIQNQLRSGYPPALPAKGISFLSWVHHLRRAVEQAAHSEQTSHWLNLCRESPSPPQELVRSGYEADARTILVRISGNETKALLTVANTQGISLHETLVAAVAHALSGITDASTVRLDIEKHGRSCGVSGPDLARTIGWFTAITPLLLRIDRSVARPLLSSVAQQLRNISADDISFGALRYLSGDSDISRRLSELPRAPILFNYLGRLDQVFDSSNCFRAVPQPVPGSRSDRTPRPYPIEIDAMLVEDALALSITYDAFSQSHAENLSSALRTSISLLIAPQRLDAAGELTDFGFDIDADEAERYSQRFQRP